MAATLSGTTRLRVLGRLSTTPPPLTLAQSPSASDIAYFNATIVTTQQIVTLNDGGTPAATALGLVFDNPIDRVVIQTNGAYPRPLELGTSGIQVLSTSKTVQFGSITAAYAVPILLQGSQTWTVDAAGTSIRNGASIGSGGNQTLTLSGIDTGATIGDNRIGAPNNDFLADGAAVLSINKTGSGRWLIYGNNTYTGTTTISEGVLFAATGTALGSTAGGTTVLSGGELLFGSNIGNEAITINGSGQNDANSKGAMRCNGGTTSYGGLVTLGSDARIAAVNNSSLTLTNAGTITGSGYDLYVGGNDNGTVTINSNIGTGAGAVIADGPGESVLNLIGNNTYTGGTAIFGGVLKVGSATALGATSGSLTLGENGSDPNWGAGKLDLNGYSMAVGALNGDIGPVNGFVGTILNDAASTNVTLTVGTGNASGAYAGVVADDSSGTGGTVALTKLGTGTQTLTGANTYSGATTLKAGTLELGESARPQFSPAPELTSKMAAVPLPTNRSFCWTTPAPRPMSRRPCCRARSPARTLPAAA